MEGLFDFIVLFGDEGDIGAVFAAVRKFRRQGGMAFGDRLIAERRIRPGKRAHPHIFVAHLAVDERKRAVRAGDGRKIDAFVVVSVFGIRFERVHLAHPSLLFARITRIRAVGKVDVGKQAVHARIRRALFVFGAFILGVGITRAAVCKRRLFPMRPLDAVLCQLVVFFLAQPIHVF